MGCTSQLFMLKQYKLHVIHDVVSIDPRHRVRTCQLELRNTAAPQPTNARTTQRIGTRNSPPYYYKILSLFIKNCTLRSIAIALALQGLFGTIISKGAAFPHYDNKGATMFVGLKMLKNFITMPPDALVEDAQRLMDEQQLWMLFVVKDGKLVGYVRQEDINAAMPSLMTGLDKHELNYLLSKLTVGRIMRKDITSVAPEAEIETAAMLMHAKNLAGLAVVNPDGDLIGYINRTIMLEVLAEEMGYGQGGSRIVFEVVDRPGVLKEVSGIIDALGYSIISTGTFTHQERRMVVIRVDTPNPSSIAAALQKAGYDVVGPEDFKHEWQ